MEDIETVRPINMNGARLIMVAETEDGREVRLTLKRLITDHGRADLIHRTRYSGLNKQPIETWRVFIDCELGAAEDEDGVLYSLEMSPPMEHDTSTFEGLL